MEVVKTTGNKRKKCGKLEVFFFSLMVQGFNCKMPQETGFRVNVFECGVGELMSFPPEPN
jgi:hypothetical protein